VYNVPVGYEGEVVMKLDDRLFDLQLAQQRHDEVSHRDILCLPIQDRVKHMALHFSKYVGRIAESLAQGESGAVNPTIIDTFIIALASANSLNIRLWERAPKFDSRLADFKTYIANLPETGEAFTNALLVRFAQVSGRLAKACESMDHIERFEFRDAFEDGVLEIVCIAACVASKASIDLPSAVNARWARIEDKALFAKSPDEPDSAHQLRVAS
jgi:hypothetical protein